MPQWFPILSWGLFILGLATAAVIAIGVTRHPQRITIMNNALRPLY